MDVHSLFIYDACTHVFYDYLSFVFFVVLILVAIRTLDSKLVLSYFIIPLSNSSTSRHDPLSLCSYAHAHSLLDMEPMSFCSFCFVLLSLEIIGPYSNH